ncbi:MAG: ATP-binding cassette domain-containing protein, partial [bacterium]
MQTFRDRLHGLCHARPPFSVGVIRSFPRQGSGSSRETKGRKALSTSRIPPPVERALPLVDTVLTVERLTLRFAGVTAIDGLSFGLRAGELLGIIGPNGAGKTSVLN